MNNTLVERFIRNILVIIVVLLTSLLKDKPDVVCNCQLMPNTTRDLYVTGDQTNETSDVTSSHRNLNSTTSGLSSHDHHSNMQLNYTEVVEVNIEYELLRCSCSNFTFDSNCEAGLINRSGKIDDTGVCNTIQCCTFNLSKDGSLLLCNYNGLFDRSVLVINDENRDLDAILLNCLTNESHLFTNYSTVRCEEFDKKIKWTSSLYILYHIENYQIVLNAIESCKHIISASRLSPLVIPDTNTNTNVSACVTDGDCSGRLTCHNNICSCVEDTVGDQCLPRTLQDTCNSSTDCIEINNSVCHGGRCGCTTSHYLALNGTCVPRTVGNECNRSSDCILTEKSICVNETCVCSEPYLFNGEKCTERILSQTCNEDTECSSVSNSFCNGTCSCKVGYLRLGNQTCRMRKIYDACHKTSDCNSVIPNSICINEQCICLEGYKHSTNNSDFCSKRILFDVCERTIDCSLSIKNSECRNNTCQCISGFVKHGENTCSRRRIGIDPCLDHSDCHDADNKSFCVNSTCTCDYGTSASSDLSACVQKNVGDSCTSDYDCLSAIENSACLFGRCTCLAGHITENNTLTCRRRIVDDDCNTNTDCAAAVKNSDCKNGTCSCIDGYVGISNGTQCFEKPTAIGDECHSSLHCRQIDPLSECEGLCQCPDKYFVDDNNASCIHFPARIGDMCSEDYHCYVMISASYCDKDLICSCQEGYYTDNNRTICWPYAITIGDRCTADNHCKQIPETHCTKGICNCTYKFVQSSDRSVCLPRIRVKVPHVQNVWLGALCDINETNPCPNWNITNQVCAGEDGRVNNRCQCKPGFANEYNAGECHEVQSYFIRVNITEELGCYPKDPDEERCYLFTPFKYIKQYSNNNTRKFRDMKLRLHILGLDYSFNRSSLWSRFVSSSFINMTEIKHGIQVSGLVNVKEDYYNVFNATQLSRILIEYLQRNDGVLGKSNLKVGRPFDEHILMDDFDECTDWYGHASDCSELAWCINTKGSYMCSCFSEYEDQSLDPNSKPGRICKPAKEKIWQIFACSDGKCETNWTWMGMSLSLLLLLLLGFLSHEIYSKRKELQNMDPVYVPVKRKSKYDKQQAPSEEENLINDAVINCEEDIKEDPPLYTEVP